MRLRSNVRIYHESISAISLRLSTFLSRESATVHGFKARSFFSPQGRGSGWGYDGSTATDCRLSKGLPVSSAPSAAQPEERLRVGERQRRDVSIALRGGRDRDACPLGLRQVCFHLHGVARGVGRPGEREVVAQADGWTQRWWLAAFEQVHTGHRAAGTNDCIAYAGEINAGQVLRSGRLD